MAPENAVTPSVKKKTSEVRVLLAEDSATVRYHLTQVINDTPDMRVIGTAHNGQEAVDLVPQLKPDVISMDISMPRLDGLEATRRIMAQAPTPVVVVSSLLDRDVELSFQAIQAGALAVVEKPPDRSHPLFQEKQHQLVKTLRAMSQVHVIRRGSTDRLPPATSAEGEALATHVTPWQMPRVLAIGASAGGPSALSKLLTGLPLESALAVLIVQHMPHEFLPGLARWLHKTSGWPVEIVEDGAPIQPGMVHLSPGTAHFTIVQDRGRLWVRLIEEPGHYRYHPAIDVLFESVADVCGTHAIGVVLSGMGEDGAAGLLQMRQAGAITFAQDRSSATVYGMPAAAVARGAVDHSLPLAQLPAAILNLM